MCECHASYRPLIRSMAARLAVHVRFPLISGDELEDTVLRAQEMDSPECQALVSEGFGLLSNVFRLTHESACALEAHKLDSRNQCLLGSIPTVWSSSFILL